VILLISAPEYLGLQVGATIAQLLPVFFMTFLWVFFVVVTAFGVLGMEPRVSHILVKHCATELTLALLRTVLRSTD
jgi:hypothetical protein